MVLYKNSEGLKEDYGSVHVYHVLKENYGSIHVYHVLNYGSLQNSFTFCLEMGDFPSHFEKEVMSCF